MNPWHELGLDESATADDIRRAYRRLAAEHHPDRNPGDESAAARFQRVRQAYEMLKNPSKMETPPTWQGPVADGVGGAWRPPGYDPFGQSSGSGVHVRFVAPEQLQALLQRLRNVLLLTIIGGLAGLTTLGHVMRGLPLAELMWPHQIILSLGMGLGVALASFFVWIVAVFGLGFRWGTLAFWGLVLFQVAR